MKKDTKVKSGKKGVKKVAHRIKNIRRERDIEQSNKGSIGLPTMFTDSQAREQASKSKVKIKGENTITPERANQTKKESASINKVLYITSECQPFVAYGGLADVAGGLTKSLAKKYKNADIRVVLPLYGEIDSIYKDNFKSISTLTVHLGWRQIYAGIFEYKKDNVTYYFIDNENYFKRKSIYGHYDDGERFAFFSKAVIQMLPVINFFPNIIHCNEWQTSLVTIYMKTEFSNHKQYNKIKHIYTIHNMEYQGKFHSSLIEDLFGIEKAYLPDLEYNKEINLVKCVLQYCDMCTVVSHSYAEELKDPLVSHGLNDVIPRHKMRKIINQIDYDFYNPQTDDVIYENYSADTYYKKAINKQRIQKDLNLPENKDVPVICMVTRLVKHKGFDLIIDIFEKFVTRVQFLIAGNGDEKYIDYFKSMECKYPNNVRAYVGRYDYEWGRKFYAASDALLMPSLNEPCGLSQMVASRYGTIPIVREVGGLKDSIQDFGCPNGGNGYTFSQYNSSDLLYSINRMIEDYKDRQSWEEKIKKVMNSNFGWDKSTDEYIKLYEEMK